MWLMRLPRMPVNQEVSLLCCSREYQFQQVRHLQEVLNSTRQWKRGLVSSRDWERCDKRRAKRPTPTHPHSLDMADLDSITIMGEDVGTGIGFGRLVLILTGVSSLVACLLTVLYVSSQSSSHDMKRNTQHRRKLTQTPPLAPPSYNAKTTASRSYSAMSSESSCWFPYSAPPHGPL